MSKSKFKKRNNKKFYGGATDDAINKVPMEIKSENDSKKGTSKENVNETSKENVNETSKENVNEENTTNVEVNQQNNGATEAAAKNKGDGEGSSFVSTFKIVFLVFYIFTKYPLKYTVLFSLFYAMIRIAKKTYEFGCKAATYFIKFFSIILDPGEFDLIVFKLPNIFAIFLAFLDLFIGLIYCCITIFFLIILGCVALPFNLIFSL